MKENYNLPHYMQLQFIEMEEHRWYMGEREDKPINDYDLLSDWIATGHAKRFNEVYMSHLDQAEKLASAYVGQIIPNSLVHKILED